MVLINDRMIKAAKAAWQGDYFPLVGEVANVLITNAFGVKVDDQGRLSPVQNATGSDAQEAFIKSLRKRESGMELILGRRGSGKTALSMRLVEIHNRSNAFAVGIPAHKLPSYIEELKPEEISKVPNDSVIVIDDAGLQYGPHSYRSATTQALQQALDLCRHREIILIPNVQRAASLDKRLCDPDVLFLKPPSLMWRRSEDDNLRQMMKPAEEAYARLAEEEGPGSWQSHVYVISDDYEGLISVSLPSEWGMSLSRNKG